MIKMQINGSCKSIETFFEGFVKFLVANDMATLIKDGYNPDIDNSLYSRTYAIHTVPDKVKAAFRYDHRPCDNGSGDRAYFEISTEGLKLVFSQLSFYTILRAIGVSLFDDNGELNKESINIICSKILEATGKRIEIKLIE